MIVEEGNLPDVADHGDRHLAAGIDVAEQRLGHGGAAFLPQIPAFHQRIGALDNARPAWRTAVQGHHGHGPAGRLECGEQVVLLTDEIEIGAVAEMCPGIAFAAGLLGVADGEDDDVGVAGDRDRLRNELAVLCRIGEQDLIGAAILALGDEDAD